MKERKIDHRNWMHRMSLFRTIHEWEREANERKWACHKIARESYGRHREIAMKQYNYIHELCMFYLRAANAIIQTLD